MTGELRLQAAPPQAEVGGSAERQQSHTWHCTSPGDGLIAVTPVAEVQERFLRAYEAAGAPVDMAVFTRLESEGRLHCQLMAYFSPAAREVAAAFDALPCTKPYRLGLELLAGDAQAWSVLFEASDGK